jgi:CheY-like chemotaxis protein
MIRANGYHLICRIRCYLPHSIPVLLGMNILHIDDDIEDREVFREALKLVYPLAIYNEARDGQNGLEVLYELIVKPDYIFLDINMPIMDGKQFLKEIRTTGFRTIPIIIYSTTQRNDEVKELLKLGALDYHAKQPTFNKICQTLKSIIQHRISHLPIFSNIKESAQLDGTTLAS